MYDAIPAKDITPSGNGKDVLDLHLGDECKVSFANALYPAKVVAVGDGMKTTSKTKSAGTQVRKSAGRM